MAVWAAVAVPFVVPSLQATQLDTQASGGFWRMAFAGGLGRSAQFGADPPARGGELASADPATEALASWVTLTAPTGHEAHAGDVILRALPDWRRDRAGNLVLRKGSGEPRRVVACGIDRAGYVVSQITPDGYLRLHRVGRADRHPLWDQWHQGHRARVLTSEGSVPGAIAVGNAHFSGSRVEPDTALVDVDQLWVDVGAASAEEARAMGIELIDPVVRELPPWTYSEYVAGPGAATRVGCAAVAAASRGDVEQGETVFLLTTLRGFGHGGLHAGLALLGGEFDQVTLLDAALISDEQAGDAPGRAEPVGDETRRSYLEAEELLPASAGVDSVLVLAPASRFGGTPVESVRRSAAQAVFAAVAKAAGTEPPSSEEPLPVVRLRLDGPPPAYVPDDSLSAIAGLLGSLSDLPGVSGHEARVRRAVLDALPAWARARVEADDEGNLTVAMGPDRDTAVFVAHLDETGWEVDDIASDGTVTLRRLGGMRPGLWEARPVLLHFDVDQDGTEGAAAPPPLGGITVPRDVTGAPGGLLARGGVTGREPDELRAWFGVDSAGLARLGVREGLSVTGYKHASRLGRTRFVARALDDRTGTTALILALRRMDPDALSNKVIFAWSVREEIGLEGAEALARRYGTSVRRAYSVDTFVSSDTPLETPHFAYAPLGQGPVLRAADNAGVTVRAERDRVRALADAAGIPLQMGITDGGVDGTAFLPWGAIHAGLSWPGRYSHSPVEVLDLRDVASLARLIAAVATSPQRAALR